MQKPVWFIRNYISTTPLNAFQKKKTSPLKTKKTYNLLILNTSKRYLNIKNP